MLKKIKHNVFISNLMNAITLGCMMGLFILAIAVKCNQAQDLLLVSGMILVILLVFSFLSLFITTPHNHKIVKRYKQCSQTIPLEEDSYMKLAKQLYVGKEWMIYHHQTTYLFFSKQDITNMTYTTKGRKLILAIYTTLHPEGEAITLTQYDPYYKDKINAFLEG